MQCDQRTERLGFNCEFVIRAPDLQIIPKCKHTTLPGFSVKNRRHWKGSSEANKECFLYRKLAMWVASLFFIIRSHFLYVQVVIAFLRVLNDYCVDKFSAL